MKKALLWIVALIIIIAGGYYFLQPKSAAAPTTQTQTTQQTTTKTQSHAQQIDLQTTGAAGVSSDAPAGSTADCAKCSDYSGAEKGQCLAALNCQ